MYLLGVITEEREGEKRKKEGKRRATVSCCFFFAFGWGRVPQFFRCSPRRAEKKGGEERKGRFPVRIVTLAFYYRGTRRGFTRVLADDLLAMGLSAEKEKEKGEGKDQLMPVS